MRTKLTLGLLVLSALASHNLCAQEIPQQDLDSVVITSSRIDLPFKENSRTVSVITSEDIATSASTNVADLLQEVAGIDIRRRGTGGMQSDLYIRGGGFDQTLLLVDGMKMEDAQTGHHTMNMAIPLETIERIEIIKGPAARVFGQNAFTGAINIVTKKNAENINSAGFQVGSYRQQNAQVTLGHDFNKSSHIAHASVNTSDGYRYNTDYNNQNYFLKSSFNKEHVPINLLAVYQQRKFGANGFYASPSATDQYEETETSLIGLSSVYKTQNLTLKPRIYWRRNQDLYLYLRYNPSYYRNLHISNKIAAEVNASYTSSWGTTGFGVDLGQTYLSSNNLGDRERFMVNGFIEHLFKLFDGKMDITPGIAMTYFSDFKFHVFPGIDVGYRLNDKVKVYGNIGYTYRIPTYTDLYYSDPTSLGNENLDPEEAIAEELGVTYSGSRFRVTAALFNRYSKKLIDYVKENEDDLWQATNIRNVNTFGVELNGNYPFKFMGYPQNLTAGYTFIEDDVKDLNLNYSRYSINSLKHQATFTLRTQFLKNVYQTLVYKYAERTAGETYNVVDASVNMAIGSLDLSLIANNIFNANYYETNLVPMPKGNVLLGATYHF